MGSQRGGKMGWIFIFYGQWRSWANQNKKKSAFLTGQANKHNRQHKRIKNWNRKAYLPKGPRTHNTEGLFIKIHHVGGVVQCGE